MRIVAEEEQTFQSFGFEQDLIRHPLAFTLQILDQPVGGLDNIPVQHFVLASCLYTLSHHRSEGPELTRPIALAARSLRALVRKRSADRLPMPPAGLFSSQTFRLDSQTLSVGREWRPLQLAPQNFRLRTFVRQATLAAKRA